MLVKGLIIKVNSDVFTIKCENEYIDCKAKGKYRFIKLKPVVGDKVLIDNEKKIIEEVEIRKNCLLRPPVANVDVAIIVTSMKEPNINYTLLDKLISIITLNNIEPVIVFTKLDLIDKKEMSTLKKIIKYYNDIGIKTFTNKKILSIKKYLKNKIVTVCGQTGAGKSTLINKFNKKLNLETHEISSSLGRGVHTTRLVNLYELKNFYIVDTPGFSSIDINMYSKDEIKNSFIEFKNNKCKFKDCSHLKENNCTIKEDVKNEKILKTRYNSYINLIEELK